ncbi:MAG: DUF4221 domain-containing protein [Mongoliibacter sp.]|uniref:DUF4221 family protein n=1 Tax=Mongoliibacter sp. TaxID=2022438 RepID=UPI0012F2EFCD|nr:DUF4221 family protein [Mongoliibacter sp.]TVP52955.1 MAG: DUF4221 domain-containing protein [Mongoliibacter sp.]
MILEKEGPDGVGEMVYDFNLLGNDLFFAGSRGRRFGIFNLYGEKQKDIDLNEFDALFDIPVSINNSLVFDQSPVSIFGDLTLWNPDGSNESRLGVWKVEDQVLNTYDINNWFKISDFKSVITTPNYDMPAYAYWFHVDTWKSQVLVSANVRSSLVRYSNGEFEVVEIDHQKIPKKMNGKLSDRYNSREEFETDFNRLQQEINYSHPVWDVESEVFYRFAYKKKSDDKESLPNAEVFLIIMDRDFKILHEIQIPQLSKSPNFHFVKDGMIWMFENVEDEVSFIRLQVSI